jgi:hypothetical protein
LGSANAAVQGLQVLLRQGREIEIQQAAGDHGGTDQQEGDPVDHHVNRLPAGAPVMRRQGPDAAAADGHPRRQLGKGEEGDVADAGGGKRPGGPDVEGVDVALRQQAGEAVRPRRFYGIAGDAQAGNKVNQEEGDNGPVEKGGREIASQTLTSVPLRRECRRFPLLH